MKLVIAVALFAFGLIGCNPSGPHLYVPTDGGGGSVAAGMLTYNGSIKAIFVQRCGACHGPGKPEPNWQDYQTAYSFRDKIYQWAVVEDKMPPPGTKQATDITEGERQEIGAWIKAGAPEDAPSGGGGGGGPTPSPSPSPDPSPSPTPAPTPQPPPNFAPIQNLLHQECFVCHSNNGNSMSPIFPRIAGQKDWYIENELKAFRSHMRKDNDAQMYMWGPASSLDDPTIQLLAEYFSTQPTVANTPGDPTRAALGKAIFENGVPAQGVPACMLCHGEAGEGSASAPRLAGQYSGYIVRQLEAFKKGERAEATVMPTFVQHLTKDDETNLANYIQGLK